jgi:hypothetical protein
MNENSYKASNEKYLKENGFIPTTWNSFEIVHYKEVQDEKTVFLIKEYIEKQVGNKAGIYVYCNEKDEVLYIGKGKPLHYRIFSHYNEAFGSNLPKKNKSFYKAINWYNFFAKHSGKLKIYWKEITVEAQRVIVEAMLEDYYRSVFHKEYPKGEHQKSKHSYNGILKSLKEVDIIKCSAYDKLTKNDHILKIHKLKSKFKLILNMTNKNVDSRLKIFTEEEQKNWGSMKAVIDNVQLNELETIINKYFE